MLDREPEGTRNLIYKREGEKILRTYKPCGATGEFMVLSSLNTDEASRQWVEAKYTAVCHKTKGHEGQHEGLISWNWTWED